MPAPTSPKSMQDLEIVLQKALESDDGVLLKFDSVAERYHFRMRLYQLRSIDRRESKKVYEKTEVGYDASEFDNLTFRYQELKEGGLGLRILRSELEELPTMLDPKTEEPL